MERNKRAVLFIVSFILASLFYRLVVLLREGEVSYLRGMTGLNIHHYHYGVLMVTVGVILLLFHGTSGWAVFFSGFGLGAVLDGFISSMFKSLSRVEEIASYTGNLFPTVVLFLGVVLIVGLVHSCKRKRLGS